MKIILLSLLIPSSLFAQSQNQDCSDCSLPAQSGNQSEIATTVLCQKFIDLQNKFEADDNRTVPVTKRLKNIKSFHSFYRSFPNLFFHILKDKEILKDFQDSRYTGIITGDPHLQNFSVFAFKDKKGKKVAKLAMDDFDDGGRGPYIADLLRHLGSLEIYRNQEDPILKSDEFKLRSLVRQYQKVIEKKGEFELSESTKKIQKKALKDMDNSSKRVNWKENKFIGEKLEPCLRDSRSVHIDTVYRKHTSGVQLDCLKKTKKTGGSAGLPRQYYITEDKKVIQVKSLPNVPASAIEKGFLKPISLSYQDKTNRLIKLSLGKEFKENYIRNVVIKGDNFLHGKNYLIKTHSEGFKKHSPAKKKKDGTFKTKKKEDRWDLIKDQVKTLAKLHSKTLKERNRIEYSKKFFGQNANRIIDAVQEIIGEYKKYYEACNI